MLRFDVLVVCAGAEFVQTRAANRRNVIGKNDFRIMCPLLGNVILDTHCTVKTPKGYMPGLPEWVIKRINPTAIVVVEADSEEIFNRRANDPSRNRDPDSVDQITEHQMMNRSAAMAYAALSGATVKIVFNHDDALDAAVKQAAPVLK